MADAEGRPTWLLTRGAVYAKDDRLPPRGWRADGPWPDETKPKGVAGRRRLRRRLGRRALRRAAGLPLDRSFVLRARLLHQTIGARWIAEWVATGLPEAESLRTLLEGADLEPSELARTTLRVEVVDGVDGVR